MEDSSILCNCTLKYLYGLDKVYVTLCSKYSLNNYKNKNKSNLIYCVSNINEIITDCYVNYNRNMQYRLYGDLFIAITKTPVNIGSSKEILCKERKLGVLINFNIKGYYEIIICID